MVFAEAGWAAARCTENIQSLRDAANNLGIACHIQGDYSRAISILKISIAHSQLLQDRKMEAYSLMNLGNVFKDIGDYPQALQHALDAKTILEAIGDEKGMIATTHTLAILNKILGNYSESYQNYQTALQYFTQKQDSNAIARITMNLGYLFQAQEMPDSARHYLQRSIQMATRIQYLSVLGRAYSGLIDIKREAGEIDSAMYYVGVARAPLLAASDSAGLIGLDLKAGTVYLKGERPEMAIPLCQKAYLSAKKVNSYELLRNACFCLANAYRATGDYQNAYQFQGEYFDADDSLKARKMRKEMEGMQVRYELEKSKNELAEVELGLVRTRLQRSLLAFTSVLTLLLAFFILLRLRTNRRKNRQLASQQKALKATLKQKEWLLGEVHHRVKNNLQVIFNLLDFQARELPPGPARDAILESRNRIISMNMVHQRLLKQEDHDAIEIQPYIRELVLGIRSSFEDKQKTIQVDSEIQALKFQVETAIPLGLIVNELVTNAFKYAFEGRSEGNIRVKLAGIEPPEGKFTFQLEVADDGIGTGSSDSPGSYGTRMIRALVRQMKGKLEFPASETGTSVIIRF